MAVVPVISAIMAIVVLSLISFAVKIAREYERGVIFRLGRLLRAKGPGVILLVPLLDRMIKMAYRVSFVVPQNPVLPKR